MVVVMDVPLGHSPREASQPLEEVEVMVVVSKPRAAVHAMPQPLSLESV